MGLSRVALSRLSLPLLTAGCQVAGISELPGAHCPGLVLQFLEVSYAVTALVTYTEWLVLNYLFSGHFTASPGECVT